LADVGDYPHDFAPDSTLFFQLNAAAEGIVMREKSFRHGAVDDHDRRSGLGIAIRERAAFQKRNLEGAE